MFWCDAEGIKTRHTDGTDQKMLYVPRTPHEKTFRSVGVYEVQSLKLSMDFKICHLDLFFSWSLAGVCSIQRILDVLYRAGVNVCIVML